MNTSHSHERLSCLYAYMLIYVCHAPWFTQAQDRETVMLTLIESYPYVLDIPEGIQRLVNEHNRKLKHVS